MEFLKEFGVEPVQLLAQIVNFTILLLLLKLFLYKPILKILEERKKKVDQSIKNVEAIEKKLARTEEEQAKLLDQARSEANKLISEAKSEAKELTEKTLVETNKITAQMLEKNNQRLDLEREKMMTDIRKEVVSLVTLATAKVTGKTITEADNIKLVSESISEVTEK